MVDNFFNCCIIIKLVIKMKNRIKKALCGILATCMIFSSGCRNDNKNENQNNDSTQTYSSHQDKVYSDVVLFKFYDDIDGVSKHYFVNLDSADFIVDEEENRDLVNNTFEDISPQTIQNCKIINVIVKYSGIVNPYVTVVNHTLLVQSENGESYIFFELDIVDAFNDLYVLYRNKSKQVNQQLSVLENSFTLGKGDKEIQNDDLTVTYVLSDKTYSYEEIKELDSLYTSKELGEENILKKSL